MPEPLTTLYRCPVCGRGTVPPRDVETNGRFACNHGDDHPLNDESGRVLMEPVSVFSAGDMQAALGRAEKAEGREQAEVLRLRLQVDGWRARVDAHKAREVELVEALRAALRVIDKTSFLTVETDLALVRASLDGAERTHEVVPLGTQEAARDLLLVIEEMSQHPASSAKGAAAIARLRALVEGVEPEPLPDCSCAMTEDSMLGCAVHGLDATEETLAAWEAAREVEGVERTPTPRDHDAIVKAIMDAQAELQTPLGFLRCNLADDMLDTDLSVIEDRLAKTLARLHGLLGSPMYQPATHPEVEPLQPIERTPTSAEVLSPEWVKAKHLEWAQGACDAMAMGFDEWFDLQVGAREPSLSGITDETVMAALRAFWSGEPDGPPFKATEPVRMRRALATALELQGGERTHTLVPREACAVASGLATLRAAVEAELEGASLMERWSDAFAAAERGEHPVQWPGDDAPRQKHGGA